MKHDPLAFLDLAPDDDDDDGPLLDLAAMKSQFDRKLKGKQTRYHT